MRVEPQKEFSAIISKDLIGYYFFEKNVTLTYMMSAFSPYTASQNYYAFMKAQNYHKAIDMFRLRRSLDASRKAFIYKRSAFFYHRTRPV